MNIHHLHNLTDDELLMYQGVVANCEPELAVAVAEEALQRLYDRPIHDEEE